MTDELGEITQDSARGGFFLFSGAALATVVMAIAAILVGRFLGPELYGQYNLVLVIPSLLLLFTDLGINAGITKFAASLRVDGKGERVARIIRFGMLFRLFTGVIVSIVSIIFAGYFAILINRPDFTFYVQIASISIIFQVIFGTVNSAFVGLDKSEYNALTTNVQAVAKTTLQIVLVLLGFSVVGCLIGYVAGFIVSSILGSIMLFSRLLKPAKNHETKYAAESYMKILRLLARYGMPLYVSVVLVGFLPLYQQVVLAFFTSDVVIGNFRAASNFLTLLSIIPTAITTALLPAFSKLDSSTPYTVNTFFRRANKYICLLMVPVTTLILLFSSQIIQIVYGSVYQSASLYLSVSSVAYYFVAIGSLSVTSLFNGLGETRLTLRVTIVNFLMLIGLSPILAQAYNIMGVLIAALIAGLVGSIYGAYIAISKLQVKFYWKPTIRIYLIALLSSILPLILLRFASSHSILALSLGTIIYLFIFVTLMPLMRIVDQKELMALEQVTRRIPLLSLVAKPLLGYQRRILLARE